MLEDVLIPPGLADNLLHRRLPDDAVGIGDADGTGAADRHGRAGGGEDALPLGAGRAGTADRRLCTAS